MFEMVFGGANIRYLTQEGAHSAEYLERILENDYWILAFVRKMTILTRSLHLTMKAS